MDVTGQSESTIEVDPTAANFDEASANYAFIGATIRAIILNNFMYFVVGGLVAFFLYRQLMKWLDERRSLELHVRAVESMRAYDHTSAMAAARQRQQEYVARCSETEAAQRAERHRQELEAKIESMVDHERAKASGRPLGGEADAAPEEMEQPPLERLRLRLVPPSPNDLPTMPPSWRPSYQPGRGEFHPTGYTRPRQ